MWKLDDINLSDYGVIVRNASGLLDIPSIVDDSINWPDQNGKEYWNNTPKYEDKEIVLSCLIHADSYANFKTKLSTFFVAITAAGVHQLETPYITLPCTLNSEVKVEKSPYIESAQIGLFQLRLTVAGDEQTNNITIYTNNLPAPHILGVFKYGSDAKITQSLQNTDQITFSFESSEKTLHGRYDYIYFRGDKYISTDPPTIVEYATNKFVYNCKFDHEFFMLRNIQFRVIDTGNTYYFGTMESIVDLIVTNTLRSANITDENGMYGHNLHFVKGTVDATEGRSHQFSGESCYEVLARIAGEYGLEFGYKTLPNKSIQINVVEKIGVVTDVYFEIGKTNELFRVERNPIATEKLVSHLYSEGSDKNIPVWFGHPRLRLPDEPITYTGFSFGEYVERTVAFPDIFPERTGYITSYTKKTKPDTWVYAPGTYPGPNPIKIYTSYPDDNTYELVDTSMDFDLKEVDESGNTEYLVPGKPAKIHFNSGDLAGFEFEVSDYDHATKTFKILPYKNEQGITYPTSVLYPKPGDAYKILDINLPSTYVDDALARLRAAMVAYVNSSHALRANYKIETSRKYDANALRAGDTVFFTDVLQPLADMRIADITTNIYSGGSTITLSDYVINSKRQDLSVKVASLERSISSSKLNEVNVIRNSEITTAQLNNKLIDPTDQKLNSQEVIRRNSIDPFMMAKDATVTPFSIEGGIVEANVGGNQNKIKISAGKFVNHNYYALDRNTIKSIE